MLSLTVQLKTHDLTLLNAGDRCMVFSTGLNQTEADPGGIRVRLARNLNGEQPGRDPPVERRTSATL